MIKNKLQKFPSTRVDQSGLSLVELLIAMALGVIIVAALAQLFVGISRNNMEMSKTNTQIESARFAMEFIREELVHAGFWGFHAPEFDDLSLGLGEKPVDTPQEVPDPCLDFVSWDQAHVDQLIGIPVAVYNPTTPPDPNVPYTCDSIVQDRLDGTDVLVVRHANTCEPGVGDCEDTGNPAQLYLRTSLCESDPPNTSPPVTGGRPYKLDTSYDPSELIRSLDCAGPAPRRTFEQTIFFVQDDPNDPTGLPTLMRSEFTYNGVDVGQSPAVPLIEGVDGFRIELGVDDRSEPYPGEPTGTPADPNSPIDWLDTEDWSTPKNRGDGIPDGPFVHCGSGCNSFQLVNAVVARIHILVRANEASAGYTDDKTYVLGTLNVPAFNDSFKRHAFTSTVRLNNVAARRETP